MRNCKGVRLLKKQTDLGPINRRRYQSDRQIDTKITRKTLDLYSRLAFVCDV